MGDLYSIPELLTLTAAAGDTLEFRPKGAKGDWSLALEGRQYRYEAGGLGCMMTRDAVLAAWSAYHNARVFELLTPLAPAVLSALERTP